MKTLVLFLIAVIAFFTGIAQRTGINTVTPSSTFDVIGTIRGDSVGVGMLPTQRLEVAGNVQIPGVNDYLYAGAGKSKTIILTPLSFIKTGTASGFPEYETTGSEMYLDGTGGASIGYNTAPVYLPDGAEITSITAFVLDNTITNAVAVAYYKTVLATGVTTQLALDFTSIPFASTTPTQVVLTPSVNVIDNSTNTYAVRVTLTNAITPVTKLYGVKINYTVTHAN